MKAQDYFVMLSNKASELAIDKDLESTFNFDLDGENGFAVLIKDGGVEVKEELIEDAKCKISGKSESFMKVINKELNPMMALLTGKVKVTDKNELIKFAKILGIMK